MAAEPRKSNCYRSDGEEGFTGKASFTGVNGTAVSVSGELATKAIDTGTIGVAVLQQTLAQGCAWQDA